MSKNIKNNLEVLNESSESLLTDIKDLTTDTNKLKNIISLFNTNQIQKNMLRICKYDELLDKISDTITKRFENKQDEFTNDELLDYLQVIQTSIEKANKSVNLVDDVAPIQLIQNNQVNINTNNLNRDSKTRITEAIQAILASAKKYNEESTIDAVDAKIVEENKDDNKVQE